MNTYYSNERNVQILISLLKANGIKKVIASPGTCNQPVVASLQYDPYFEIYSSIDERSAAYMACGLAEESGEPVVLSCTGATAARNYVPGLTEAFYRKLPILAVTSSRPSANIGHLIPQVTDRRSPMPDIARLSVQINHVYDDDSEWECNVLLNKAILELRHRGSGPVHVNLISKGSTYYAKTLPHSRVIERILSTQSVPNLAGEKIGVFVGAHTCWTDELTKLVERFCEKYNAVVIQDHTGNYPGKYAILPNLVTNQARYHAPCKDLDIMIHIGEVSGAYAKISPKQVWRVNPDGEIRDTYRTLRYVFEMEETTFFETYNNLTENCEDNTSFYTEWKREFDSIAEKIPELPFSNGWIAQRTASNLPENSVIHFAILNSLRMWNYFEMPSSVRAYCNTGGFGIDGCISSLIGASLANPQKLFFCVTGDLAFFYDMNVLGNRHIGSNVRIILINNGRGNEFHLYTNSAVPAGMTGDQIDPYIAAAGHYGDQSPDLVKQYTENLGFEYRSVKNKEEYLSILEWLIQPQFTEKPLFLEVFTDGALETQAYSIVDHLKNSINGMQKEIAMNVLGPKGVHIAKNLLGEKGIQKVKKIIKG